MGKIRKEKKMNITEIFRAGIEIQCEIVYCCYDYETERRKEITYDEAKEKDIRYIYCEDNKIFIEIENE